MREERGWWYEELPVLSVSCLATVGSWDVELTP